MLIIIHVNIFKYTFQILSEKNNKIIYNVRIDPNDIIRKMTEKEITYYVDNKNFIENMKKYNL